MLESDDRPSQCEIQAVVKVLNKEQVGACEIYRKLCAMYDQNNIMAICNVYRWVDMINDGRMSTYDDAQDSRPSNTVDDKIVNVVCTLLEENWHYMLDNLHHEIATQYKYVSYSQTSIHTILIKHLEI